MIHTLLNQQDMAVCCSLGAKNKKNIQFARMLSLESLLFLAKVLFL